MSHDPPGGDKSDVDDGGNGDDVTEIVQADEPENKSPGDATQILPMRSTKSSATQDLPGTVIGVAGGKENVPDGGAPDVGGQAPPDDDETATKILFSKSPESEIAASETSSQTSNTEEVNVEALTPDSTPIPEEDLPADSESGEVKTVFLPPVSKSIETDDFNPPVAVLIVVDGPGRGNMCPVYYGQNSLGRGVDQRIALNFGDSRISRDTHAFILFDELDRKFFVRDNGKENIVRVNDAPVMTPTELNSRDRITVGETTLLFLPICDQTFDWLSAGDDDPETGPGDKT